MTTQPIHFMSARELVERMLSKELSAREVLDAHLQQIDRVNPRVNAIITLMPEQARKRAGQADAAIMRGEVLGPLHGLPIAHKDVLDTAGIRTTYGSPIYAEHVPSMDALPVERIKRAGAISIGKTNVPEFGAGSQTFNPVFGATRNPYDLSRTCGGSSGGAAVALACGMLPIADGNDVGGSLRNPASFCNVVGLRTSPGRVPAWPQGLGWFPIPVEGPMARCVVDAALMLSAMAGPDDRSPIALEEAGARFAQPLDRNFRGTRIAWLGDMGGVPFDPRVRTVVDARRGTFAALGCIVEDAEPAGLAEADDIFKTLRAWNFELSRGADVAAHRDKIKDTVVWNVEAGLALTGPQVAAAEARRTRLYQRVREFMTRYDFMVLPTVQVPPFDVTQPYVTEISGQRMETYIDWMRSCYYISTLGNPAISVPAGFTPEGLPIGIQIVGRHRDDWGVLQLAHAFEQATLVGLRRPAIAL
jgi:amidase